MGANDLFEPDQADVLRAELAAARAANPEALVFRANRWQPGSTSPTPEATGVMVVPKGKREDRPPHFSMLLGIAAVFGVDEMNFGMPDELARSMK